MFDLCVKKKIVIIILGGKRVENARVQEGEEDKMKEKEH